MPANLTKTLQLYRTATAKPDAFFEVFKEEYNSLYPNQNWMSLHAQQLFFEQVLYSMQCIAHHLDLQ